MIDKRFIKALQYVLTFEGGKCDIKGDRGGKTAYGITQMTYSKWLADNELKNKDVFEITEEEIQAIYSVYWNESHASQINDDKVATYIFDIAVNSGVRRSSITAQKALKSMGITLTVDGIIGTVTLGLMNSQAVNPTILLTKMIAERLRFIDAIISNDNVQEKFRKGWERRAKAISI